MASAKLEKLNEQRKAINARILREQNKLKGTERRNDTRRKILAGAVVLELATQDNDYSKRLMQDLERFLTKYADRVLFNLPPLRAASA